MTKRNQPTKGGVDYAKKRISESGKVFGTPNTTIW